MAVLCLVCPKQIIVMKTSYYKPMEELRNII